MSGTPLARSSRTTSAVGDLTRDHLVLALPRVHQVGVVGVGGRERVAGLVEGAPGVELGVPDHRAAVGEEPLELGRVGDEVAVELAGVPVAQYPADGETPVADRKSVG